MPVVTTSCAFYLCTRNCGCAERPAFPAPSVFRRDTKMDHSGMSVPRGCGVVSLPCYSGATRKRRARNPYSRRAWPLGHSRKSKRPSAPSSFSRMRQAASAMVVMDFGPAPPAQNWRLRQFCRDGASRNDEGAVDIRTPPLPCPSIAAHTPDSDTPPTNFQPAR
jgi:hypothetical protein